MIGRQVVFIECGRGYIYMIRNSDEMDMAMSGSVAIGYKEGSGRCTHIGTIFPDKPTEIAVKVKQ